MQYGPLAQAIENLLTCYTTKPPKKDRDGNNQWTAQISRCWWEIGEATDRFYDDVRAGRIQKGD
jgi:hypothetical protein